MSLPLKQIRTSAAGVALAKKLFTPGLQGSISPTQITSILKGLGLNVPPGVQVGADVAQIIMAGGAIAKGIDEGAQLGSLISGGTSLLGAGVDIMKSVGIFTGDGGMVLTLLLDAAMVVAGGFVNIYADIAFIIDSISAALGKDDRPEITSKLHNQDVNAAYAWFNARENAQSKAAALAFGDYHNGKLTIFEYLGKVAEVAPDLFTTYFPQFKAFLPPAIITHCETSTGTAGHGGLLGIGRQVANLSDTFCLTVNSIQNQMPVLQNAFIQVFVVQPFAPYGVISSMPKSAVAQYGYPNNASNIGVNAHGSPVYPRISLPDLAVLSMFPPYISHIGDDFDVTQILRKMMITPNDMDSSIVYDQMKIGDFGGVQVDKPPGLTVNGMNLFSSSALSYNKGVDANNLELNQAIAADKAGDITALLKIPRALKVLREWGIMPYIPGQMESKLPKIYQSTDGTCSCKMPGGYRNIQNYWSAISTADMIRRDPYMLTSNIASLNNYLPPGGWLEEKHKKLLGITVGRQMNALARTNIAGFFGTTPDKMKFINGGDGGKLIQAVPH